MFPIANLNGLDVAFGPRSCRDIMPTYEECMKTRTTWSKHESLVSKWFFVGLSKIELVPRPGVDEEAALRHIRVILGSFEPKHEHKEAACAYLLNEWFSDVKWTAKE